jgi:hypothetical protein
MNNENSGHPAWGALEQTILRNINQRTWGCLHQLRVEVMEDRVVVHGYTSRYYIKQLAIQAAQEALGSQYMSRIEVDIPVCENNSFIGPSYGRRNG